MTDHAAPATPGATPLAGTGRAPGSQPYTGFKCRFDDWIGGRFLELSEPRERIHVRAGSELPAAWQAIETARRAGRWVALLLDYELGEWLEPALAQPEGPRRPTQVSAPQAPQAAAGTDEASVQATWPRLTALVCDRAQYRRRPPTPPRAAPPLPEVPAQPGIPFEQYAQHIAAIHSGIARGDYYQINYTLPLQLTWPTDLDPEQCYDYLAARHPVAHAACVQDGKRWVLSFSPELFVARTGTQLRVRPMKGTAPRHRDPAADRRSARALQDSEKDRAENLMIVDLLRNDLGRIATPGSVQVASLFDLEAYPSVWTLTSTVEAEAPDVPLPEVLHALFPCGSVTGAPKIAAMRTIRQLEQRRRGIYCGSVGWLAPSGDFSLNVAIRTIELYGDTAQFGVGGGIVYDSLADKEWEECQWKARILQPR